MDSWFKQEAEATRRTFRISAQETAEKLTRYSVEEAIHYLCIVIRSRELEDSEITWLCEQHIGERIDAHCRYHAYCIVHAAQSHKYATPKRENDFQDIPLLFQLARPSLLVTKDYKFIEGVDASGTVQAPWVTTLGELLTCATPTGNPWGPAARNLHAGFKPRTAAQLGALEKEALADL